MSKHYAVKQGRQKGIYSSWAQCSAQTNGFSGALYKSFPSREEALHWLHDGQVPVHEQLKAQAPLRAHRKIDEAQQAGILLQQLVTVEEGMATLMKSRLEIINDPGNQQTGEAFNYGPVNLPVFAKCKYELCDRRVLDTHPRQVVIYIDGSKRPTINHRGSGAYCRFNQQDYCQSVPFTPEIGHRYGINPEDFDKLSSPTMEYLGLAHCMYSLLQLQLPLNPDGRMRIPNPRLRLVFVGDYNGVKFFTEGSWQPKEDYILKIRNFCVAVIADLKDRGVDVQLVHTAGHAGTLGNELADIMAKSPVAHDTMPYLVQAISASLHN